MSKKQNKGGKMEDLKQLAKKAKKRLKTDFWSKTKTQIDESARLAKDKGLNENKIKSFVGQKLQSHLKGEKVDEFYLKVKNLLDKEGEVSDAIGRLTDHEYYATLSYEEKQRYNLELSAKYLKALEKYRKEKEICV